MVAGLQIIDATIRYGALTAVDSVSLGVSPGEVVALLGASGSGKSTLLRAVAGLEPLAGGRLTWDGVPLDGVPVHKRNFGLVFQDGQLFPTMTVGRNIAYGLGRLPRTEQRARVAELLRLVGLEGYEDRRPTELSGGQAQRVALARSLAPRPRMILLDEPLSALDSGLRRRLTEDLARILRETETTAIYVTHDHQEAYTVADRVAVLDEGELLQVAAPEDLRHAPASRQVAAFLGARAFITQATAEELGWAGLLELGQVLGVLPSSLVLAADGAEVEVLDQGYTPDDVEVWVRLPDGQRAAVSSPDRVTAPSVRVRLIGGARVLA